ncbi:MAG: DUF3098 domain-containing protein [Chitinophagaceae bacterium]
MKSTRTTSAATEKERTRTSNAPLFEKDNYVWMIAGVVVMAIGFLLMAGGKSPDPNVFNDNEVYGFRRITLAPIVILSGLVLLTIALLRRPKNS